MKQLNSGSDAIGSNGFVVAPWMVTDFIPAVLIEPTFTYQGWQPLVEEWILKSEPSTNPLHEISITANSTKTVDYNRQVEAIKTAIADGEIEKAILSRLLVVELPRDFDPINALQKACAKYPDAFCYFIYLPGMGQWMGASPELLIETNGDRLKTVSLAGTQADKGVPLDQVIWGKKEIHEQQLVTNHIVACLNAFTSEVSILGPNTVKAANILHLKTLFEAELPHENQTERLRQLLDALHPTPAISGLPKDRAIALIGKIEPHQRKYYAGLIGSVSEDSNKLYVNLRCMSLDSNKACLYLGSGITAGSSADAEWQETAAKATTLLDILT